MLPNLRTLALALALGLLAAPALPADLGTTPNSSIETPADEQVLHDALSRYLTLEMIRATFDVISRDDLETGLGDQLRLWGDRAPSEAVLADLDRQLLAEASYYLVSLQYVIEVGGAAFPEDRPEGSYSNDSLVRLTALQRELPERVAAREDVTPLLVAAERIRALTEGHVDVPDDFSVFAEHEKILASVWEARLDRAQT